MTTGTRDHEGDFRKDLIARAKAKSQILAQQKHFHGNVVAAEQKSEQKEQSEMPQPKGLKELVAAKVVVDNKANSQAAYWSSDYTLQNWRHAQEHGDKATVSEMAKTKAEISAQMAKEREIHALYTQFQHHPLKNVTYQAQHAKLKGQSGSLFYKASLDGKAPHSARMELFSESDSHAQPVQDDAATFMHSRRFLSTLGFLRPNQATGVTSMANRVSVHSHVGFKGQLTHSDCARFPYYSDSVSGEFAYIVPLELKASLSLARKKALYLSSCIRIIWSETQTTERNCPLWLSQQFVATRRHPSAETPIIYIRITAQSHGLYRVSINGESVLPHLLGTKSKKKK